MWEYNCGVTSAFVVRASARPETHQFHGVSEFPEVGACFRMQVVFRFACGTAPLKRGNRGFTPQERCDERSALVVRASARPETRQFHGVSEFPDIGACFPGQVVFRFACGLPR